MKILEIASAEEQLALVRVIFDNTWRALEQQAEQQRRTQAKAKPKTKQAAKPKPRSPQRAQPTARALTAPKLPPPLPTLTSKPKSTALPSQSAANLPISQPFVSPSLANKTGLSVYKTHSLGRTNTVQRNDLDDDDRHS